MILSGVLLALAACIGVMILLRDWRVVLVLVGVCACLEAWLVRWSARSAGSLPLEQVSNLLAGIELTTGISVALILLVTGLTYSQGYNSVAIDEFAMMELRRAARRAARAPVPTGLDLYRLPALTLVVVFIGTLVLPQVYPFVPSVVDYAWTLLLIGGVGVLATSDTLLKLGAGLLVLLSGLKLCYLSLSIDVGLLEVVLLSMVTILLTLIVAYLSGLLFARLGTLRLEQLFQSTNDQRPTTNADQRPITPYTK